MSETRDILMRTKRLLTSGRWCQHAMRKFHGNGEDPSFCLVGGLRETTDHHKRGLSTDYVLACKALSEAVAGRDVSSFNLGVLEHFIISYNDATGRTVDEVAAMIDRAAERVSA